MKGTPLLVAELEKLPQSPRIARLVANARGGLYHDFRTPLATPKMQLRADLLACGLGALAARVVDGDFDDPPPRRVPR
jgi:hypothetical protein